MKQIHKTAIVEDGAILGEDCVVEAYAFVSKDAKIGTRIDLFAIGVDRLKNRTIL